jgi:hypothetical protein
VRKSSSAREEAETLEKGIINILGHRVSNTLKHQKYLTTRVSFDSVPGNVSTKTRSCLLSSLNHETETVIQIPVLPIPTYFMSSSSEVRRETLWDEIH